MDKRTQLVLGVVGIAGVILIIISVIFFFGGGGSEQTPEGGYFGSGGSERDFPVGSGDGSFASSTPVFYGEGDELPQLRRLTNEAVSGATVLSQRVDLLEHQIARFVERRTGHVVEADLTRFSPLKTLSLTTIPRVQNAEWSKTGSTTVIQYLDSQAKTVFTFIASLVAQENGLDEFVSDDTASSTAELDVLTSETNNAPYGYEGDFFPEDTQAFSFSPNSDEVFYLSPTLFGSIGYVYNVEDGTEREVWRHPLRQFNVRWDAPDEVLMVSRPANGMPGYVFIVNVVDGSYEVPLSERLSVTASMSPDGTYVAFAHTTEGFPTFEVLDRTTGTTQRLPEVTLPEKCLWSNMGTSSVLYCGVPRSAPNAQSFPERWYKGQESFNDVLMKLDVATRKSTLIIDPVDAVGQMLDVVDLTRSPDGNYLVFRSKHDDSLWSLSLEEQ